MAFIVWFIVILVLLFILLKILISVNSGWCKSQVCLLGKTVIVTGANTGIGFEAAKDFAMRGARVILACRNEAKANEAKEKIIRDTNNENVVVKLVNMSSLDSVRRFAKDILNTEERLDILVNNAGAGGLPETLTKDGLQLITQINYFSSFLLTNLLIDLLKKSAPSRIVNVSSITAKGARSLDVDNLNNFYSAPQSYANSKLCNILFTQECARRLAGSGVTSYSLHPGVVLTEVWRRLPSMILPVFMFLGKLLFKNAREGAQTTLHVALTKGLEEYDGEHFSDCHYVKRYETATDPELPRKLWENTVKLMKLGPDEVKI